MIKSPVLTLRLQIYGRVQGVFFRESMRRHALELGVRGWVRNCRDGSVEAMIQGDADAIARMRDWAQRGPPAAWVERVDEAPGEGEFSDFQRWPNA